MADIRINALANTASSTASDDFLAVDGTTNGTRKLNAYSPTFGGNLTVSATTGTNSFASVLSVAGANIQTNRVVAVTGGTGNSYFDGASIVNNNVLVLGSSGSNYGFVSNVNATTWSLGYGATKTSTGTAALSWTDSGAVTLAGNLTVSGGTATLNNATESYLMLQIGGANKGAFDAIGTTLNVINYSAGTTDFYIGGINPANKVLSLSSTASTVAGNLTVSGTGTSSFAGRLNVFNGSSILPQANFGTGSGNGLFINILAPTQTFFGGGMAFETSAWIARGGTTASGYHLNAGAHVWYGDTGLTNGNSFTPTARMTLTTGGNFLLGTTVDSGALLQVGTNTTTSAGGMIFGTDTKLYRSGVGCLTIDYAGNAATLRLAETGTTKAQIETYIGDLYVSTKTAGKSLILRSGAEVAALTLDSSQRCILAGALRLNNAYTAGAPTATGYVTIQDSAGNTYKVLVGT